MNTLELMIEDIYKRNGYFYTTSEIKSVAEYIEDYNNSKDADEPTYTPEMWYVDSKLNCPEDFVKKTDVMCKIADYFLQQRELCVEQTGCLPCYADFAQTMECDDYKNKIGQFFDRVNMTAFINFLLDYYQSEGKIDD